MSCGIIAIHNTMCADERAERLRKLSLGEPGHWMREGPGYRSIRQYNSRRGNAMSQSISAAPFSYSGYRFNWSQSEKKIARRAFEFALTQELNELMAETKRRASQMAQVDDIWDLAEYIAIRRKHINDRYDYRYSVLPTVFATLIKAGRLSENDLEGL